MSLSQEPALSVLSQYFVCGVRDISDETYAGASGKHGNFGAAVNTTNGAGPHNLQIFMLSPDGTVLTCLPGFWGAQDLCQEMSLAAQLNKIWQDQSLSRAQKNQLFAKMQLNHVQQHSAGMSKRSRMQGFDVKYERENRPQSDFFDASGVKTVDVVMHERMAHRPFVQYEKFDVAAYSDYGKPMYDKQEDFRDSRGKVDQYAARESPKIGNATGKKNRYEESSDQRGWGNGQSANSGLWGQPQSSSSSQIWGSR